MPLRTVYLAWPCLALLFAGLTTSPAAGQLRSPLISEIEAQQRGLTRAWYAQVSVDRTRDRVDHVTLNDGVLFVQTQRGSITALDGESGARLWATSIGSPDHPTTSVGANQSYVAALNGSNLFVLSRDTGRVVWQKRMKGAPGAGPALTDRHIFVPMINGLVEGYRLDDHRQPPWIYNSSGRAIVQPVVTPHSVGWPTDRGLFYVAGSQQLGVRFRVEARDSIVTKAGYIAPHLYVGSLDGYLYKVHERSGSLVWRFSTGQPISQQPLAIQDRVFVPTQRSGLFCISTDAADELWWTPGIEQVLAVSPERIYGIDTAGRLNVLRKDTGAVLARFATEHLDLLVTNTENDRVYVGTRNGLIQCLREPEMVEPYNHSGPSRAEPEPVEIEQRGFDDMPDEPADPRPRPAEPDPFGGDDPFGDDNPFGADDPFGGGGASDPFGGGGAGDAPPRDDPFGDGQDPFGGDDDPFGDDNPFGG